MSDPPAPVEALTRVESNPQLPEDARRRTSNQLRTEIAELPRQTVSSAGTDWGGYIGGFLITLIPLYFLTRPDVKRVFS